MVGSGRRRLATGAAAVVLAANLCAAMDPCTLCQEAVTQLVEGKVSGCGTPGTNADFEEVRGSRPQALLQRRFPTELAGGVGGSPRSARESCRASS